MRIYLDSKDVIDIFQTSYPCSASAFQSFVLDGGHEIVVSSYTIFEISAPLLHPTVCGNVMTLLNGLEKLPILYVHPDVRGMELKEAFHAFSSKREYRAVMPFVKRFDQSLDMSAKPVTSKFINYSLAEIVWDLYTMGGLKEIDFAGPMRTLISKDRKMARPPSLESHFARVIDRNLRDDGLQCSEVKRFADWIYRNPNRCPGIRLSYEVWHQIVKNKTDVLEDSDMEDHHHLICFPYVDRMTLDKRMHGYVSQAARRMSLNTSGRLFRSVEEILKSK